jgi:hypothetical protein
MCPENALSRIECDSARLHPQLDKAHFAMTNVSPLATARELLLVLLVAQSPPSWRSLVATESQSKINHGSA